MHLSVEIVSNHLESVFVLYSWSELFHFILLYQALTPSTGEKVSRDVSSWWLNKHFEIVAIMIVSKLRYSLLVAFQSISFQKPFVNDTGFCSNNELYTHSVYLIIDSFLKYLKIICTIFLKSKKSIFTFLISESNLWINYNSIIMAY